jgi:hypothetical protein
MANHKKYYKGEGGDFLQVRAVVSFENLCMPAARPCTKNAPTHPSYPPKCCELGKNTSILSFIVFTFELAFESFKEFEGASC